MNIPHPLLRRTAALAGLLLACTLPLSAQTAPAAAPAAAPEHPIVARMKALDAQRDANFAAGGIALMNRNLLVAAEALIREFPDRGEPYGLLVDVAFSSEDADARRLFERVRDAAAAGERFQRMAAGQLSRLDRVGQPLALKFTTFDGREFDAAQHRGKVIVIDWWATWCGPCIKDLPEFKAAVARFAPRGVVFVGISLDNDREKLAAFLQQEAMDWPQHFDGGGWRNAFSIEFGVRSIPALWLVDKQGVLRDTYGRSDLGGKIERLLAE